MKKYDIVVVGAGPAGLSAAMYTSRRAMSTLLISKDIGGQAAATDIMENYPGFLSISGYDLMQKFLEQAQQQGAEVLSGEVTKIEKQKDNSYIVTTVVEKFQCSAVILAFGLTPRDLGVPGEAELRYKGVTSCATCDGPLFKGKDVIVVGGGNAALDAIEYMSKLANKVYAVVRAEKFKGEQVLIDRLKQCQNVEVIFNAQIKEIKGSGKVESATISLANADGTLTGREISVSGIIVEIGYIAKTDWVASLVKLNDKKEIITDRDNRTSDPGVFSCGDVSDITYKQAVISAGEGAKAALQAVKYLQAKSGTAPVTGVGIDWGKKA
ncbi:MAG: FAD-dependent oxidoreductase [Candidatus Komeilibacteria bacterium]